MKDATFQNRERALAQICADTDQTVLLNIYGEGGIGKTRLLKEARQQILTMFSSALILYVDMKQIQSGQMESVLLALMEQAQGQLQIADQDAEQVAGEIVTQLSILAENMAVYLVFDTTELFQENMSFWHWMESYLVGPLAVEGRVRQIFAGRVPVPWRRVEVRRIVKHLPLEPLSPDNDARNLVHEILQENNPSLEDEKTLQEAVDIVLNYSIGHPALSEKLANYVATRWPTSSPYEFEQGLCQQVVKPFIVQQFFKDIEHPWDKILWWASVLDWFDATVLQRYLKKVAPELIKDRADYFFIQGISRLRIHHTIIWREERGDRLHGVVGIIVRQCLKTLEPDRYHRACQAAAETLEALADEFPKEYPEYQQYHQEAKDYRQRAIQEREK